MGVICESKHVLAALRSVMKVEVGDFDLQLPLGILNLVMLYGKKVAYIPFRYGGWRKNALNSLFGYTTHI